MPPTPCPDKRARKWHPVDPEQSVLVDHYRGGIDALVAEHGRVKVLSKDGGLEGKGQGVGQLDGLIQSVEGIGPR